MRVREPEAGWDLGGACIPVKILRNRRGDFCFRLLDSDENEIPVLPFTKVQKEIQVGSPLRKEYMQ